jgi:hypothetical protein
MKSIFPFIHGIMADNADNAMQEIYSILVENDGELPELIGIAKLNFNQQNL